MTLATNDIEKQLCQSLCGEVKLHPLEEGVWALSTPFRFPDGDAISLYLQRMDSGGWRVTDLGHTWMEISYDNDIGIFRKGTRGNLLESILAESGIIEDEGEFRLDCVAEDLGRSLFRLAQGISRIYDLTFLNRERTQDTFQEDVEEILGKLLPLGEIQTDYVVKEIQDGDKYPVDFRITGKERQVFIFAVNGRDKARLVTIYLHHFLRQKVSFDSLCILRDLKDVPKADLTRLLNAGDEMVASLDDQEALQRKLLRFTA